MQKMQLAEQNFVRMRTSEADDLPGVQAEDGMGPRVPCATRRPHFADSVIQPVQSQGDTGLAFSGGALQLSAVMLGACASTARMA